MSFLGIFAASGETGLRFIASMTLISEDDNSLSCCKVFNFRNRVESAIIVHHIENIFT